MHRKPKADNTLTCIAAIITLSIVSGSATIRHIRGRRDANLFSDDLANGSGDRHGKTRILQLLVVVPFTRFDVQSIQTNLDAWKRLGPICNSDSQSGKTAELWFYYNKSLAELPASFLHLEKMPVYTEATQCFARVRVVGANLTDEENDYPAGINLMFYRLITGVGFAPTDLLHVHAVFWMEPDVFPIKSCWLDALVSEALLVEDDYWVKGSMYLGDMFDGSVGTDWTWVGHINGNAMYRLHQPLFIEFLRVVMDIQPPDHYWKPFDVSIWKVLNDFPYFWHAYQRIAKHFVYADFVQNLGFSPSEDAMENSRGNARTFLVHHGKNSSGKTRFQEKYRSSAGQRRRRVNWDGAIDPRTDGISVFMRGRAIDADSIRAAVSSVMTHMPGAVEIVLVVADQDLSFLSNRLGTLLRSLTKLHLLAEKALPQDISSQRMQETYTHSLADSYCRGKYIFHMQPDSVLVRKVYHKDFFFAFKPIMWYSDSSRPSNEWWRKGTSIALGEDDMQHAPRRTPGRCREHVVPRGAYAQLRAHIQRIHNRSFESFLMTRMTTKSCMLHDPVSKCFPSLDEDHVGIAYSHALVMGTFILTHMHDATSCLPLAQSRDYTRQALVPIVIPFVSMPSSPIGEPKRSREGVVDEK